LCSSMSRAKTLRLRSVQRPFLPEINCSLLHDIGYWDETCTEPGRSVARLCKHAFRDERMDKAGFRPGWHAADENKLPFFDKIVPVKLPGLCYIRSGQVHTQS
jgi:hypothetical protein